MIQNTLQEPEWYLARTSAYEFGKTLQKTKVKLTDSLNKTLATNLKTLHPLPPFDSAMMDGYAICGNSPWEIVGTILAGGTEIEIKDGEAVVIATGAKIPQKTFAVLRQEHANLIENKLTVKVGHSISLGKDIRKKGEEADVGIEVLRSGIEINPAVIGLAASCGYDELEVFENPVIDVFVSGDELLDQGLPINGKIRDSLSMQIPGWIYNSDAIIDKVSRITDDFKETFKEISNSKADIILTTGGTAKGSVDHIHEVIKTLKGTILINEVKVRPGHPMLLATIGENRFLVGLPGNPLAAIVAFISLALPVIRKMQGRDLENLEKIKINKDFLAPENEHRLFPVKIENNEATPVQHWGSAMLRGVAQSNAFVIVPPNGAKAGAILDYLRTPW